MSKKIKSLFWLAGSSLMLLTVFCLAARAEEPSPDSPIPILLNETDASRVLAVRAADWDGINIPTENQKAFRVGRKTELVLFVKNLSLMSGEGANAVRVYLNHRNGRKYQLETVDLIEINDNLRALKIRLHDPQGYRGQPPSNGDALIYATWRGLASNQLKIGLGKTGGEINIPTTEKAAYEKSQEIVNEDNFIVYTTLGDRVRFMEQASFGPSPTLDLRLRRTGLRRWLDEQFNEAVPTLAYPNIPQMPTAPPVDCARLTGPNCFRERYTLHPLQQWFFKEAFYGNAQLRHRITWSLSQIWVTSGVQIQQSSHYIAYHKALSNHAFGNYRDLMYEMTLNPAMGDYLDMARSTKANPNENYPREIMQLFSIGLYLLNQDGTLQLDNNGQPIPTYTQETVDNFSKVLTGWTFCNQTCPNSALGIVNYKDPMILFPANHDTSAKTLLNYPNAVNSAIPACADCATSENTTSYANASLNQALDNIFYHPNTAPFVGKLLIQHLVTSDPSSAYVGRVAAVFGNNGSGVRGDMKAVIKAILLDPEARGSIKTAPRYGKLREPVQLLTNLARLFKARSFSGDDLSDGSLSQHTDKLGQNPFYSPTVFNYYPPDYIVPGTTLLAPEFGIVNTGTAVGRLNLLYIFVFEGFTPGGAEALRGTALDLSDLVPLSEADSSGGQMVDYLNAKMMHGVMTDAHRTNILNAIAAVPASNHLLRAKTAVYLIAASSQYQVQR